ncbi:hypothetical protein NXH76_03005 [Blautia schinkii]|nr:hypothetical protein [Blautia schinkii]
MKRKWNKLISGVICVSLALPGSVVYAGEPKLESVQDYDTDVERMTEEAIDVEVFDSAQEIVDVDEETTDEASQGEESVLFSTSEIEEDVFTDGNSDISFSGDEGPVLAAGESVPIDTVHFPDDNFRYFILGLEYENGDGDEELSTEEISNITELEYCEADDYSGIEYLTALREIDIRSTDSAVAFSLDISKNIKLRRVSINVYYNSYKNKEILMNQSINFGNALTSLEDIYLSGVYLASFDVSIFTGITTVTMQDCSVESVVMSGSRTLSVCSLQDLQNVRSLEFGALPALKNLKIFRVNSLNAFSLPIAPDLKVLSIGEKLEEISLSSYPKLTTLGLTGNRLKSLDLSCCPDLEEIDVSYNDLTFLDATGLPNLKFLNCWMNNLTEIKGDKEKFIGYPEPQRKANIDLYTNILYASQLWDEVMLMEFWRGVNIINPRGLTPEKTNAGACSYFVIDEFEGNSTDVSFDLDVRYLDLVLPVNYHLTRAEKEKLDVPKISEIYETDKKREIYWNHVVGAEGFYVYRKINDSAYKKIATVKGGNKNYYIDKTSTWAKYSYKVKAYGKVNGKTATSAYSNVRTYINQYNWKPKLTARPGTKSATLTWKKLNGATGYQIYRATSKKGKYTKVATIKKGTTVKYTDNKLQAKKIYYYKIRPYLTVSKKNTYGSFSGIVKVTTR